MNSRPQQLARGSGRSPTLVSCCLVDIPFLVASFLLFPFLNSFVLLCFDSYFTFTTRVPYLAYSAPQKFSCFINSVRVHAFKYR